MEAIRENDGFFSEVGNSFFIKVFTKMFLGLLLTAAIAYYSFASGLYLKIASSGLYFILLIAELAVVIVFSFLFKKLSPIVVTVLFYLYAALTGTSLGSIFWLYNMETIFYAFLITGAFFGGLALYGYTTNKDISKAGPVLTIALLVGVVASIINIFLGNELINIVLDWVMLIVFAGLTIYDINKLKNISQVVEYNTDKLYVYGAMELYLDFINMFLRILRILARSKRK